MSAALREPQGGPEPDRRAAPPEAGLTRDTLIALSYVGGWTTGLCVWLVERDDPAVRFHGAQAALLFGGLTILWIGLWAGSFLVLTLSAVGFTVFQRLAQAVLIAGVVLWLVALFKAWQGRSWRVPIIAALADRLARV